MKKFYLYLLLITIVLLNLSVCSAQQDNSYTNDWYEAAVKNLQQLEYNFYPQQDHDAFRVTNGKNHISFETAPDHYMVRNTVQSLSERAWDVKFSLKGIGRHQLSWKPGTHFSIVTKDGLVAYKYDDVEVEYVNTTDGLRQNFTIDNKPSGNGSLRIAMHVSGNLSAVLNNGKLSFVEKNDTTVKLVYNDLKVWDANNNSLPASMTYDSKSQELNLIVDDSHAVYPVLVDPLNHTPEWSTSADGLLSGVLTNQQLNSALYGFTVSSLGDVNGDGYGDVAISAPGLVNIFSGAGNLASVGAVFVYYGSFSGLPITPSRTLQPNTAVAGALFGFSVDAGDVTGDGRNDIIIGAPLDKYNVHVQTALLGGAPLGLGPLYGDLEVKAGKVYIYRSEDLPSGPNPSSFLEIKLDNSFFSPGLAGLLSGNINVSALFGFSVAATDDLNGDNKADVVIGSPSYLSTSLLSVQNGAAFVYYSNNLSTTTPVQLQVPSLSLLGLAQLPVTNASSLLFGYSVDGVGDYNNDGFSDVVIGAPAGVDLSSLGGALTGEILGGSAYVYYGNGTGMTASIGARLQASSTGLLSNAANLFGFKVKGMKNISGAHNGNIMVGAPLGGLIPGALSLTIQSGNINLFIKKASSPSGVVTANQVIESPKSSSLLQLLNTLQLNVLFGASFDNAYDINCDSYPDLVVGEPLSSGTNLSQLQVNAVGGSAYVFYGMADGTFNANPVYTASVTYGGDILSVNATALFGFSVAGVPKITGPTAKPRILVGSPSGALDFSSSLLNLGSTLNTLFSFAVGDNGLGKAYTFDPALCGASHTLADKRIDFSGEKITETVHLNWVATGEENINQYVVEKSADGSNFTVIGYVFSKGTASRNTYSLTDNRPLRGTNYYRLRIIEKDDSYTYSQIVRINFAELLTGNIVVAPNPVENNFKVYLTGLEKGAYTMDLRNTAGQIVQKKMINVDQSVYSENMSRNNSMAAGIYYLRVSNQKNGQIRVIKIMVK